MFHILEVGLPLQFRHLYFTGLYGNSKETQTFFKCSYVYTRSYTKTGLTSFLPYLSLKSYITAVGLEYSESKYVC
jgi:hypothetical protein